jgi:hypothetical protein
VCGRCPDATDLVATFEGCFSKITPSSATSHQRPRCAEGEARGQGLLSQTELSTPYVRLAPKATELVRHNKPSLSADFVAKVEPKSDLVQVGLGEMREICSAWEILSQQTIGVLRCASQQISVPSVVESVRALRRAAGLEASNTSGRAAGTP